MPTMRRTKLALELSQESSLQLVLHNGRPPQQRGGPASLPRPHFTRLFNNSAGNAEGLVSARASALQTNNRRSHETGTSSRRLPFMCGCHACREVAATLRPPRITPSRLDCEDAIPPMQLPPACSPVSEPEEWLLSRRYETITTTTTTRTTEHWSRYSKETRQSRKQTQQPSHRYGDVSRVGGVEPSSSTSTHTSTRMERTISQPHKGRPSRVPRPLAENGNLNSVSDDCGPESGTSETSGGNRTAN